MNALPFHPSQLAAALALLLCMGGQVDAHETNPQTVVAPLLARDLAGQPGKEVVMLTVEYPPGGGSEPHRHEAQVLVYVLQGTLRTQVEGQAAVTLKAGETFYENPQDIHVASANASATEPVKFLVVMVKDKNKPASLPVNGGNAP
ncbi:MAG TPA: cupin domain-containing protein [Lysobacter sp.]